MRASSVAVNSFSAKAIAHGCGVQLALWCAN
jgi:hypothetical protein